MGHDAISAGRREIHVDFLDQLRGLAILLVFTFHCFQYSFDLDARGNPAPVAWMHIADWTWAFYPFSLGWVGVPIFFVISGFCIHLSHARVGEKGFKTFFIRRFFRIYPPYLVALLFFAMVFPSSRLTFHAWSDLTNFLTHLVLVHNFGLLNCYGINGAFWSIAVEVQLYLLYPLLLWMTRGVGWNRCLILLLVVELFFESLPLQRLDLPPLSAGYVQALVHGPFTYWFSWAIGAKIADDWLAKRPLFTSRYLFGICLLCFLASGLFFKLGRYGFLFGSISTALAITSLLSSPGLAARLLALPLGTHLRRAGLVSYSMYLLHEPFVGFGSRLVGARLPNREIVFFTCLLEWPFLLLLSWGFYCLVEMPSIRWGKRLLQKSGSTARVPRRPEASLP